LTFPNKQKGDGDTMPTIPLNTEVTPEIWEVESSDQFGCYKIVQAAREQDLWVDQGFDQDDDGKEGERREEIAKNHDRGNRFLIQTACNGCKKAHPSNPVEAAMAIPFMPALYNALNWITRSVRAEGPCETTAHLISDKVMEEARRIVEKMQNIVKTNQFGEWVTKERGTND
jgi:hypothetical protein